MEKGVEKILLERQVAKDRGVLGAVNVAVWHRSVVHEPKKDLEKRLPDKVAKKYVFPRFFADDVRCIDMRGRYMTKRVVSERLGMLHTFNADVRAETYKGARGGDEERVTEHLSKSTRAIEKIFQA